jgi:uncharacterized membrane protein
MSYQSAPPSGGGYPPPPPSGGWQGYPQQPHAPQPQLGTGLQVTAIVAGIFGVIFGLIPLTFFLAWTFGLVALIVGIMAYRRAKEVGRKQGRAGIVMGTVALVLGIIGVVIVADAGEELDDDLDCLAEADTSAEIEACND